MIIPVPIPLNWLDPDGGGYGSEAVGFGEVRSRWMLTTAPLTRLTASTMAFWRSCLGGLATGGSRTGSSAVDDGLLPGVWASATKPASTSMDKGPRSNSNRR